MIKIYLFGDSHCKCFIRKNITLKHKCFSVSNMYQSSSTIVGLNKLDNSSLKYGSLILDFTSKIGKNDYIVLMFGHVDIHYNLIYKTLIKKEVINYKEFVDNITNSYMDFISKLKKYTNNIILCGIVPCNEENDVYRYHYFDKPYNISTIPKDFDYQIQFKRTLHLNKVLKKKAKKNNIIYIDYITETCINRNNKWLVKDEFNSTDEHFKGAETDIDNFPLSYSRRINTLFLNKLFTIIPNENDDHNICNCFICNKNIE